MDGTPSQAVVFTPIAPPNAPVINDVFGINTTDFNISRVFIKWDKPITNASIITGYIIKNYSQVIGEIDAPTTQNITAEYYLPMYTLYSFTITPKYKLTNTSTVLESTNISTPYLFTSEPRPDRPYQPSVLVIPTNNQVTVFWNIPTPVYVNSLPTAHEVKIYSGQGNIINATPIDSRTVLNTLTTAVPIIPTTTTNPSTYTIFTGLQRTQPYTITVVAINSIGNSIVTSRWVTTTS